MIELPETYVLAGQINQTLIGKTIRPAAADTHHHAFAWYTGYLLNTTASSRARR